MIHICLRHCSGVPEVVSEVQSKLERFQNLKYLYQNIGPSSSQIS